MNNAVPGLSFLTVCSSLRPSEVPNAVYLQKDWDHVTHHRLHILKQKLTLDLRLDRKVSGMCPVQHAALNCHFLAPALALSPAGCVPGAS